MTKSTQILDVSYGTFSCRLEGFEDSVETMKTVVSFFHDLAGHDRFMDIEPQAPDMEELALLTAEQAGTDIEIAGEGHNVILRAADEEDDAEEAVATEAETETEIDLVDDDHDDHDEIEDAVASDTDDEEIENVFDEVDAEANEDSIVLTDAAPVEEDEAAFDDADFENVSDVDDDDYVEDIDEEDDQPLAAEADVEDAPADDDEEESIAAKLQRIRAVVGRGHVQAPTEPVAQDDDLDDDIADEEDEHDDVPVINPLAQRLADLAKRNADLAAADAEAEAIQEEVAVADESAEDAFDSAEAADDFADEENFEEDTETAEEVPHDPLVLTPAPSAQAGADTDEEEAFEDDAEEDADSFDLSAELSDVAREIEERDAQRTRGAELPDSPDTAFSRILNQTDEHLNEPEGRRHRDAFAQLKAAVAATEAARELGDAGPSEAKDSAFREDLGAHDAEEKSEVKDPSPLRLVPTQTPDAPTDAAAARLRQIASKVEENMAPASGGFAEFAQEQGATELSDLLEAAAAYIAFVEGDDDFSRPQVMKKVQSATQEEVSREDGLRSFGRLLRQNKIVKLNNGRFQVAENTRFRPSGT